MTTNRLSAKGLFKLAEKHGVEAVEQALQVPIPHTHLDTALWKTIESFQSKSRRQVSIAVHIINMLQYAGAKINKYTLPQKQLNHLLHGAVKSFPKYSDNHIPTVFLIFDMLLEAGAKVPLFRSDILEYYVEEIASLCHYCCFYGNVSVLQKVLTNVPNKTLWLSFRIPYKIKDQRKQPLIFAAMKGNFNCIELLLPYYFVWRIPLDSLLQFCQKCNQFRSLLRLCRAKLTFNHIYAFNVLHPKSVPLIALLLANYSVLPERQFAKLIKWALLRNHEQFMEKLIKYKVSVKLPVDFGISPTLRTDKAWGFFTTFVAEHPHYLHNVLLKVVEEGNISCLQHFLQDDIRNMIDLNERGVKNTALVTAVSNRKWKCVIELLKYDLDVTIRDSYNKLPLEAFLEVASVPFRCTCMNKCSCLMYDAFKALVRYGFDNNFYYYETTKYLIRWDPKVLEAFILAGADVSLFQPYVVTIRQVSLRDSCQRVLDQTLRERPCSLKHLTRLRIRVVLGTKIPLKLATLGGIPRTLKDYLMLPELDDIIVKT